jgi:hypothetical protein
MPDDLRTTVVIGARLLAGWACTAVAVLDLSMGPDPGSYLVFHLGLLAGGLLLLGLGKLPKTLNPFGYGVIFALAVLATVLAALPSTTSGCCLHTLDVRHGYPLTLLAWDPGQSRHFAPAHAVADLVFWFLIGMLLLALVTQVLPGRRRPAPDEPAAPPAHHDADEPPVLIGDHAVLPRADDAASPPADDAASPRGEDQATHAEERAAAAGESAAVADDENVGGLP